MSGHRVHRGVLLPRRRRLHGLAAVLPLVLASAVVAAGPTVLLIVLGGTGRAAAAGRSKSLKDE